MIATLLAVGLAGTVVLRGEAQIAGPTVELGEIAEVRGATPEETERVSALVLGNSPAPGAVRFLRREDVARAVRAAGHALDPIGAAACRMTARVETVTGAEIASAAQRTLAGLFGARDIHIEVARPAADVQIVAAAARRDLVADLGRREPQPGAWTVPVDIVTDGVRAQTAWVTLDVHVFEDLPVTTRELRRGEPLDPAAWTLVRTRVDPHTPRSADPRLLPGATCTRDLPSGARITESDVRRDPVIRSGDVVELEVVRGPIRARVRATARGAGAIGDRIEVQSGEGQRRTIAVVVERGLVRVELATPAR